MNTDFNMYDTDDVVTDKTESDNIRINKTMTTIELKIADKTVRIIDPDYVMSLQRKLTSMESRVKFLENELRNIKTTVRTRESMESLKYRSNDDYE